MTLPGRTSSSTAYRYGFQGQEKDDELKGEGNSLNYTFRMHDPRVGRFFAVDPLTKTYPHYTPYSFSGNRVIRFVELEGLEEFDAFKKKALEIGARIGLVDINHPLLNPYSSRAGNSMAYQTEQWNKQSRARFREQPGKNITGNYFGDAILHLANYEMFHDAWTGEKPHARGVLFMNALVALHPGSRESFGTQTFTNRRIGGDLVVDSWERAMFGGRAWGRVDGKQVAFYSKKGFRGLEMEINIPKNLEGMGYGSEFFAHAVKESEESIFTATWVKSTSLYENSGGQSVNLTQYLDAIEKYGLQAKEKAAFSTWSGKRAKENGFNSVEVKEIPNGIEAKFTIEYDDID